MKYGPLYILQMIIGGKVFLLYWYMGFCIFHTWKSKDFITWICNCLYFTLYKTGKKLYLHEIWNLYFSHLSISEQIFIQKNTELYISYMNIWLQIFPHEMWNSLYITFETWPPIYHKLWNFLCITYENLCPNYPLGSTEHYVRHAWKTGC